MGDVEKRGHKEPVEPYLVRILRVFILEATRRGTFLARGKLGVKEGDGGAVSGGAGSGKEVEEDRADTDIIELVVGVVLITGSV